MTDQLPNLDTSLATGTLVNADDHKPRILLLYGSTRERSFSRLLVEEAAEIAASSPTTSDGSSSPQWALIAGPKYTGQASPAV